MPSLTPEARNLLRTALLIFVVTIVIGILNGMDIWQPSHEMLLTHVHAGTLGWITLAVIAAAILMFDAGAGGSVRSMSAVVIGATLLYVVTFATTTGILRPIAGTLMLAAIVWALAWVGGQYGRSAKTTPQLGMLLAMVSLTIGAVLGVLLGLFVARGSIPGLDPETAATLAGAHPPAMLIGYLILAGVALTDWILQGPEKRSGRIVVWALFLAGIVVNVAFILAIDLLIQVATFLEVAAIITFLVRMWPRIKPAAWTGDDADLGRTAVGFLAVGIVLLVYLVQLVTSGQLNPETREGPVGVLLAFDHAMFIGVMTNAVFATIAASSSRSTQARAVLWAVNGGLILFLIGLVADVTILKQVGAPVMGIALLWGIYVFFAALNSPRIEAVT